MQHFSGFTVLLRNTTLNLKGHECRDGILVDKVSLPPQLPNWDSSCLELHWWHRQEVYYASCLSGDRAMCFSLRSVMDEAKLLSVKSLTLDEHFGIMCSSLKSPSRYIVKEKFFYCFHWPGSFRHIIYVAYLARFYKLMQFALKIAENGNSHYNAYLTKNK